MEVETNCCYGLGDFYDKTHYRNKDKSEESNKQNTFPRSCSHTRSGLKMDNSCENLTKAIPMETINLGPVKWILHDLGFPSSLHSRFSYDGLWLLLRFFKIVFEKFSKEKESFFRKESFKNFSIEFEELKFYYKS